MKPDLIVQHFEAVKQLSKPGQPLAPNAPTSTVNNPLWWQAGSPGKERSQLHARLLAEAFARTPDAVRDRKAIVLAGPPGAGKSTMLAQILGQDQHKYLIIDADNFKRALLEEALKDNSYNTWLTPPEVRTRQAAGERFFPLELASLVHEESSFLATLMRRDVIRDGYNVVVDAVLSSESGALNLGQELHAAGYEIHVIDVEVPFEISEANIRQRWQDSYQQALAGNNPLGGRWVPSEYTKDVFSAPNNQSKPMLAARTLATNCPAVTRYQVFTTTTEQHQQGQALGLHPTPELTTELIRKEIGGRLINTQKPWQLNPPKPNTKTTTRKATPPNRNRPHQPTKAKGIGR